MSQSNAKDLRKQIRNVLGEMRDEIVTHIAIDAIRKEVMERLKTLEDRHKDFQSLALRELAKQQVSVRPSTSNGS